MTDRGAAPAAPASKAAPVAPGLFAGKAMFWWMWPFLVALDLWSKAWVFGWLDTQQPGIHPDARSHVVFDGMLSFRLVTWSNTGTIWGLFQNATVILIVLRCCALVALLWYLRQTPARHRLQVFVLGLIFAGALGNLYDNFVCENGGVRDFLRFSGTWPVEWGFPAFNVADSCISVGAVGLLILLMREPARSPAGGAGRTTEPTGRA